MRILVENFRRLHRAIIEPSPLALVCGLNEAGKSSLQQAVAAALSGAGNVTPGVTKAGAACLVHDGEKAGRVVISDDEAEVSVSFPSCQVKTSGPFRFASECALGIEKPLRMKPANLAGWMNAFLGTAPDEEEFTREMEAAGFSAKAIASAWAEVNELGWDAAKVAAEKRRAELAGEWKGVTGQNFGSKAAASWSPEGFDETRTQEELAEAANAARVGRDRAVAARAVQDADKAGLEAQVASLPELRRRAKALRETANKTNEAYDAIIREGLPLAPQQLCCPECNAKLNLIDGELRKRSLDFDEAKRQHAAHMERREKAQAENNKALAAARDAETAVTQAESAEKRLADLEAKAGEFAGVDTDVDAATARCQKAEAALAAAGKAREAKALYQRWEANNNLAGLLAPDGIRRRVLVKKLDPLHAELAALAAVAGWKPVTFTADLNVEVGGRPYHLMSEGAQWRADTLLQLVIAARRKDPLVLLDRADVVHRSAQNELFKLLQHTGQRVLVCMTYVSADKVPDLAAAGLGKSYWLEDGLSHPLGAPQQQAAE